jgi:hypothetical protein
MSWSVSSATAGGTGPYTQETVVLQGTGRTPNPTGGSQLTRTVSQTIAVLQVPQPFTSPPYWNELYSGATGQPCDLQLGQGVNASAPIYAAGNLCLTSAASIEGSATTLVTLTVMGNIRLQNGGDDIGKTTKLTSVAVGQGCVKSNNGSYVSPCPINSSSTDIYDKSGRTTAPAPTAQALPAVLWATIAAKQAASTVSCTNGVSLSSATFYLTPSSGAGSTGYTCTVGDPVGGSVVGSIVYNSTAHTLTMSGAVYLSGSLDLSTPSPTTYTGVTSLFVAGTVGAANGSVLCVHLTSGKCDYANANTVGATDYWDTTKSILIIESEGAFAATNIGFQGGLYSATSINLGGGQASTQGPLVSPLLIVPGQQLNLNFPNIPKVSSDSNPGSQPMYTLAAPKGYGSY